MAKEKVEKVSIGDLFKEKGIEIDDSKVQQPLTPRQILRPLVRGYYSIQKTKIRIGNQILANIYRKFGLKAGQKKEKLDKVAEKVMKLLLGEYKRITKGVVMRAVEIATYLKDSQGVIDDDVMFTLIHTYKNLDRQQDFIQAQIGYHLEDFPIWNEFLKPIPGVGISMAGVIISELDPHEAPHPSSFVKYAGMDVVWLAEEVDGEEIIWGEGRSRKAHHRIEKTYKDSAGNTIKTLGLTYNPLLKTKMFLLGTLFLQHKTPLYSDTYYDYKVRTQGRREWFIKGLSKGEVIYKKHPHDKEGLLSLTPEAINLCQEWWEKNKKKATFEKTKTFIRTKICTDKQIHFMSLRSSVKLFLTNLWTSWRALEGLPVTGTYAEDVLHLTYKPDKNYPLTGIDEDLRDQPPAE